MRWICEDCVKELKLVRKKGDKTYKSKKGECPYCADEAKLISTDAFIWPL